MLRLLQRRIDVAPAGVEERGEGLGSLHRRLDEALPGAQQAASGDRVRRGREPCPGTFATFDAFADDARCDAHLSGPIAAALMGKADELLASPPEIRRVDVLAAAPA